MQILSGGRSSNKLSFVLLLIDDFTGKPITMAEAVKVIIEGAPSTAAQIIKKGGYREFTGFEGDEVMLDIVSAHYSRRRVLIKRSRLNNKEPNKGQHKEPYKEPSKEPSKEPNNEPYKEPSKEPNKEQYKEPSKEPSKEPYKEPNKGQHKEPNKEPIEFIRLCPNESYRMPRDTTSIKLSVRSHTGEPCPNFKMRVILRGDLENKLLVGAKAGSKEISLSNFDMQSVEGKGFAICESGHSICKGDDKVEFVTAIGVRDSHTIELKAPLEREHNAGEEVLVFYDCETDSKCILYIPFSECLGICESVYIMYESPPATDKGGEKGETKIAERAITAGCKNLLESIDL